MENRKDLITKLRSLQKRKADLYVIQQTLLHPYIYPQNRPELMRVNQEIYNVRQEIIKIKSELLGDEANG